MKKKNYRVVSVSERLPHKDGWYFIILDGTAKTVSWFHSNIETWGVSDKKVGELKQSMVSHWLEEIKAVKPSKEVYVISNNDGWDVVVEVFTTLEEFWKHFNYIKGIQDLDYSKFPMQIEDGATGLIVFKKELK